jgi:hypothetical protein
LKSSLKIIGSTTLSIIAISIKTLSIITNAETLSIISLGIMTLGLTLKSVIILYIKNQQFNPLC